MSPLQQKPILHGRDHLTGGPDPIPGLGGGSSAFGPGQPGQRIGATENRWYVASHMTVGGGATTGVSIVNARALWPFTPSRDYTLDRIAVYVTSGGEVASSKVRLGIYTDDGNLYPDALLFDTGDVATTSSGKKETTISQAVTANAIYWVAIHYSHSSLQLRGVHKGDCMPILGWNEPSGSSPEPGLGWTETLTYAALPDPYPAGAVPITASTALISEVYLRGVPS